MNYLIEWSGLFPQLYQGEILNDDRHGFGIQVFMNQSVYVGNWENGQANGIGKIYGRWWIGKMGG